MADPFIFISTSVVKEGKLDEYRSHFGDVVDLVREEDPDMLYFALHVDDEGREESTVQVHSNPENMAHHMKRVADHVDAAREYLDFSRMSIQIFGHPTEPVLEQMRQLAGSGVPVKVKGRAVGFDRISDI